jgi:hypothetical protein
VKKFVSLFTVVFATLLVLAGCGIPEGMNKEFYNKADSIFAEVDDDTMELENSDADDIANVNLVIGMAQTKREKVAAEALEAIVKLQDKVIHGDQKALQEYMKARNAFGKAMGYKQMPTFEFTEETD